VFDGIWYGTVTTSTVGYGDKVAKSKLGRFWMIIWMIVSVICSAIFGGTISAQLTVSQISPPPATLQDLRGASVGVIRNSSPADVVRKAGANITLLQYPAEGYIKMQSGEISFFVVDIQWDVIEY
jgi:ABC-type amino acid transport substrate-binding protein